MKTLKKATNPILQIVSFVTVLGAILKPWAMQLLALPELLKEVVAESATTAEAKAAWRKFVYAENQEAADEAAKNLSGFLVKAVHESNAKRLKWAEREKASDAEEAEREAARADGKAMDELVRKAEAVKTLEHQLEQVAKAVKLLFAQSNVQTNTATRKSLGDAAELMTKQALQLARPVIQKVTSEEDANMATQAMWATIRAKVDKDEWA